MKVTVLRLERERSRREKCGWSYTLSIFDRRFRLFRSDAEDLFTMAARMVRCTFGIDSESAKERRRG